MIGALIGCKIKHATLKLPLATFKG